MNIQFDRPAEAMAAITWVVCSADSIGSEQEYSYIHNQIRSMELFKDMNINEFSSLMGSIRTKLFCNLPNDGFCLAESGVKQVIDSANMVFDTKQKEAAIQMAIDLAKSDELVGSEKIIIEQIRTGFNLD